MQTHIYATFDDPKQAEKAAGALLDNGLKAEDLTVIQHKVQDNPAESSVVAKEMVMSPVFLGQPTVPIILQTPSGPAEPEFDVDQNAKHGISTTTAKDAEIGAAFGAAWGLGIGTVAALAAIFIPGIGLVIGGGALASALTLGAATTGAGTVAGLVTGYLKDQGFEEGDAKHYVGIVEDGGAILSVALPSGNLDEPGAWDIINKYNGTALTRRETMPASY